MLFSATELRETLLTNPTLGVLVVMSIVTLALALERLYWLRKHRKIWDHSASSLLAHLRDGHADSAVSLCHSLPRHAATDAFEWVLLHGDKDISQAALTRSLARLSRRAKRRLWIIGSSASVAPFVGLFGTVVGIMRAFQALAQEPGGGVQVVGGGIAEALVTTAAGIFVAIEAVVLFNALQVLSASTVSQARETTEILLEAKRGQFAPQGSHGHPHR